MKNDQFKAELASLTTAELEHELAKRRASYYLNAVLMGFMVGVSVYGASRKGLSFFTLLPLVFLPMLIAGQRRYKEVQTELNSRKK